jgi:hypothetical protein
VENLWISQEAAFPAGLKRFWLLVRQQLLDFCSLPVELPQMGQTYERVDWKIYAAWSLIVLTKLESSKIKLTSWPQK